MSKRVIVIGATGVLGRPVVGDLFSASSLVTALRGHDAVLNLATRIPRKMTSKSAGALNDQVRISGSAALAAAVREVDEVRIVVQEGISFVYADGGAAVLTEDAPLRSAGVTGSSVTAHANVAALTDRTVVRLRIGTPLGTDAMTSALLGTAHPSRQGPGKVAVA